MLSQNTTRESKEACSAALCAGAQQRLGAGAAIAKVNACPGTWKAEKAGLWVPIDCPQSPPQQSTLGTWPSAAVWLAVGNVPNILRKQQLFIVYFYLFTYGWILGSQHLWCDINFSQQIPQPCVIFASLHFSNNIPYTNLSFAVSQSTWAQHTATTLYLL